MRLQPEYRKSCSASQELLVILGAILDRLTMLYLPVDIHQGRTDRTEDLMVIYERLALRDATFCRPSLSEEYQSMNGADMIRNSRGNGLVQGLLACLGTAGLKTKYQNSRLDCIDLEAAKRQDK